MTENELVVDGDVPDPGIAQTERIGLVDAVIAALIAVATWTLLTLWGLPLVHPSNWDDVAVASGVRPASHLLCGYFVAFGSAVFRLFGLQTGGKILNALGPIVMSGIAVVAYAALREMLAFVMRARIQRSRRRSFVMQVASVVGTFALLFSEPVWFAGQYLSETTVLLALTVLALEFFFVFLRKGTLKYAYFCAISLGLLAAETPVALMFLIGFLVVNHIVLKLFPILESPFFEPAVIAVSKWYMTFICAFAFVIGAGVNCTSFVMNHGLAVEGLSAGRLTLAYLSGWADVLSSAASPIGWLFWAIVCLLPLVVVIIRLPAAADVETFLSYATGIVFLLCGLVAFTQVAPIPELWFWTHCTVVSDYLLAVGLLWSATTIAAAVTVLGVDSLCRNHARLARQMFGQDEDGSDEAEDEKEDDELALNSPVSTAIRRTAVVLVPTAMVLAMLPGRMETKTRATLGIVKDALAEIVTEAGDAEYVFTDGNLDTGIELESRSRGGNLKCLPLVSREAEDSARDVYLRTRGMANDAEDLFSFRFDTGTGLRSWIRDKPKRLEKCAAMMGFDLWKRDGKALPPMGGMLSRPTGWTSEDERLASVDRAHKLAARIMDVHRMDGKVTSGPVRDAFDAVQWRLARLCTYRSEQADLAGDAKTALAEADMAQRLDGQNEAYKSLLEAMGKQNDLMLSRLTPREGLQLALVRADFTMGKMYAETILIADPENADANFALGMFYAKGRQFARAEEYLRRCLARRPDEPSVYNNLAMVEMELGRLDEAESNAKKALAIIPESAAVQDTLKTIRAKREGKAAAPEKK